MSAKQPKQTLAAIAVMLLMMVSVISCNNNADASKVGTDTSKMAADTLSKMSTPGDTMMKKVDTIKMDTAAPKPVKTTS